MKTTSILLILLIGSPALAWEGAGAPAPARKVDTVDHEFGLTLPDPYRWMEGDKNTEFAAWLQDQGVFGRAQLDRLPRLRFWRERLGAAAGAGVINRQQTPWAGGCSS